MKQIIVVGAGPAGMMAAIRAAENGAEVTLLEKMKKPGRKMMITGKGRCNITNAADVPEIIRNIHGNGAFLNSSMHAFDNEDVMEFFRQQGVPVKVERGNRVFPVSDKAQDVVDAMVHRLHELGVKIELEMPVQDILTQDGRVAGVRTKSGAHYKADAVILAVGGASYPGTGSTGDGYEMAKKLGHTIVSLRPSLVPLETEEEWVKDLQGLSLRNVRVTLLANNEKVQEMFGEMMFTHFGVTGPIILSLSRKAAECLAAGKYVELEINLKPALTPEKLDARIQRDFEKYIRKSLKNGLVDLLPHKLIEPLLDYAFLDADRPVNQVTAAERHRLVEVLQHLILVVTKTRPLSEAIVTAGGVSVREIDPKTMESKLVPGLYFAGEVTDVDAYTGGYNLQAAFSMGNAAGCWSVWNDD
ncbi:MAG: NAD(P)/FAD-dependent oxidoreductase [Mitsuokella multacida]|jgi:predicted Rossmann fold flavoprotein